MSANIAPVSQRREMLWERQNYCLTMECNLPISDIATAVDRSRVFFDIKMFL